MKNKNKYEKDYKDFISTFHPSINKNTIGICIYCKKPIALNKEQEKMIKFFKNSPELLKDYMEQFNDKLGIVCKKCSKLF